MRKEDDFDFMVVGQKKADDQSFSLGQKTGKTLLDEDKLGITASLDKNINGRKDSFDLKGPKDDGKGNSLLTASKFSSDVAPLIKPTPRHDVYGKIGAGGVKSRLKPSQKNFSFGRGVPFSGSESQFKNNMFSSRLAKAAIGSLGLNPKFGFHGSEFGIGPKTIQGMRFQGAFPLMAFQQWSKAVASTYHDANEEGEE